MRRARVLVAGVALALVLALALGSLGLLGGGRALGASTTLTVLSGEVSVRHGNAGALVPAVDGELLAVGDTVQTAYDARAVLTFFEGSTVTIEPATQLRLNEARATPRATFVDLSQAGGRTWHVVQGLFSRESRYRVHTPASTASVRGTEFEVLSDPLFTTIRSTGGVVVAEVPDPSRSGAILEMPIPPGQQHEQLRNKAPAAPQPAPEPLRTLTITVGAANSLVVDPVGRANGFAPDGRLVLQTPGAKVARNGDGIVITLPDLPGGRIATRVERARGDDSDVKVTAVVMTKGGARDEITSLATAGRADRTVLAGLELKKQSDGKPARALDESEQTGLSTPKIGNVPGTSGSPHEAPTNAAPTREQQSTEPAKSAKPTDEATRPPKTDTIETAKSSPKTEAPSRSPARTESQKIDAPKSDAPKTDAPKTDAPKAPASNVVPRLDLPQLPGGPRNETQKPEAPKEPPKSDQKPDAKFDRNADLKTDPSERNNERGRPGR